MELKEGMLAISKAGHDKACWYVVLKLEGENAFLVNGENRSLDRPKKKKLKHVNKTNKKADLDENVSNSDVRKMLQKV